MDDPEFARLIEVDSGILHMFTNGFVVGIFSMAEIFSIQFYPDPERDVP